MAFFVMILKMALSMGSFHLREWYYFSKYQCSSHNYMLCTKQENFSNRLIVIGSIRVSIGLECNTICKCYLIWHCCICWLSKLFDLFSWVWFQSPLKMVVAHFLFCWHHCNFKSNEIGHQFPTSNIFFKIG